MKKLTPRQIVHLHQMARAGTLASEIANALRINRNSVMAHLRGDVTYPTALVAKLGIAVDLVERPWLDQREAAPWVPGHPSPAKMHRLMRTKLRSVSRNGRRVTKLQWIADYCKEYYRPGIWIRPAMFVANVNGLILNVMPSPVQLDLATNPDMRGKLRVYALCVAQRIAAENCATLDLPAWLIHRAVRVQAAVGTAVI